jgi:hypothetical protein
MAKCGVFYAVRTEFLNIIQMSFGFKGKKELIDDLKYSIPTLELTNKITEMASLNNFPLEVTNEIITLTEHITKQNYFEMNSKFYIQLEGLAMGAPSSAVLF